MILRPYQESSVNEAASMLASGKRKIIFQLPTGAGKTVCFSAISKRYIERSEKSVLILVHRIELLQQTRRTLFNHFNISSQPIVAGMKHIPPARVYIGMIETVFNRLHKLHNIGLVMPDEAHLANFFKVHDHFKTQFMIGFTATPISANKRKPLKDFYEDIVCSVQIPDLIKMGSLAQNITYAPRDVVDRASLTIKGGEFDDGIMAAQFSKPRYINNTVTAYKNYAPGTKGLIFNVNIDHSKQVDAAFKIAGLDSRHIDGTTSSIERKHTLQWFENTPGAILNNVGIATTGTDIPSIEAIVVNKSTMSMPLLSQMEGRGGRPTESKSAFAIIDMGGNTMVHGDWDSPRDWKELFHNPPRGRSSAGVAPVKYCPQCDAIIAAQARECIHCGYLYPAKEIELEEELSDFVIVTKGIDVRRVIDDNRQRKEYYPFFAIGKKMATDARKTIPHMNDEIAGFILDRYLVLTKEWCHETGKKFNQWHQDRAKEHLYNELAGQYKNWQNPLTKNVAA